MKRINFLIGVFLVLVLLAGCAAPQPEEAAPEVGAPEAEAPADTPVPEPTTVPKKLVMALTTELDSLDIHKSGNVWAIGQHYGASLVLRDPETGEFIPYLATSWEKDGINWIFHLRDDVVFHNGTPLTAADYAWSFSRAINPETMSPTAGPSLQGLLSVELIDDYTFKFIMGMPNSVMLNTLADTCYHQPLNQAYVEEMGEEYGRNPLGVGPFKFVEWVTGDHVTLEANPAFDWAPAYASGGAPKVEQIEFRFIPEYATQLAGLEAGDIHYLWSLESRDIATFMEDDRFELFSNLSWGSGMQITFNLPKAPFDDINVRKAMNMMLDREAIVEIVLLGYGVPLYGPATPSAYGYWQGVEEIGYHYDLEGAKAQLEEAGYTPGDDGIYQKDGERLSFTLALTPDTVKTAEVLQQQFAAGGVEIELEQLDFGVFNQQVGGGDFDIALGSYGWPDIGILFAQYHTLMLNGGYNYSQIDDPDLSAMLMGMVASPDEPTFYDFGEKIQRYLVENAYNIPIYAEEYYQVVSKEVNGYLWDPYEATLRFFDASIE